MMKQELVWIRFGTGGYSSFNAVSSVDRNQAIYGIAFDASKNRYAYTERYTPMYNRIGFDWKADNIAIKRMYETSLRHYYYDSEVKNEAPANCRIWLDSYGDRIIYKQQVGGNDSGWLSFANGNLLSETITLEDRTSIAVKSYRWNEADKLHSCDTGGPCPLYLCVCGSSVDMESIFILVNRNDNRTTFNWG